MLIELEAIGKRFHKEWIFKNVTQIFESPGKYALIGHNGSGKSTLLQIITGISLPTAGKITFRNQEGLVPAELAPLQFSFAAPYQELPEELTGAELFAFHFQFRQKRETISSPVFFSRIGIANQEHKQIKYYSSGMKQRLRLGLCFMTRSEGYFLDEPGTNLDKQGLEWYQQLVSEILQEELVIISSNIEEEYKYCTAILDIRNFKPSLS